ncbi:uncharacterized protein LOC120127510 [Hibiscus syriacus]|uniref:uncharacterized protein LOC120127510 n=1 Tax=Hibiscus syriacus TaxID=106335 RepID=UPI001922F57D|nr:uncharacterized protein LOC120127510 [Hibiscus syriacus]
MEAVAQFGPGFKPPSMHELRVPLLKNEKDIVNFLVNSPKGSVFLKSLDVSKIKKDANTLFKMLDYMVEKIGEENVVQVVTDNASNYVKAGMMLKATRPYLYWTPCAAHCIDLMLEDIGKILKVQNTLKSAIFMIGYIYIHVGIVNMMRRLQNQETYIGPQSPDLQHRSSVSPRCINKKTICER